MTEVLERPSLGDQETLYRTAEEHERRFGNQEIVHLPLDSLLMVSQIRGCENPAQNDLKESIDQEDLDNPINVARVTEAELDDYLDFTNRTWGSSLTIADVEQYRQLDGLFNLVVGGHSRTISIQELAAEHTERTGQPTNWEIQSKLLKDTSVFGIVSKQLSENIHKGAPIEREAMAIVEIYSVGFGKEWTDVKGFQKAMKGKLKKSTINAAVAFHSLPTPIRNQVYKKEMPYEAGVALGKSVDTMRLYFVIKAGYDTGKGIDDEAYAILDELTSEQLNYWAGRITDKKWSSSQARMIIRSQVKTWNAKIQIMVAEANGEDTQDLQDSLFEEIKMVDPKEELRKELRKQRAKNEKLFREMAEAPMQRATELIAELNDTQNSPVARAILEDARRSTESIDRHLTKRTGEVAVLNVMASEDEALDQPLAM